MNEPQIETDLDRADTQAAPENHPIGRLNKRFHDFIGALTAEKQALVDDGSVPVVVRIDDRMILADGDRIVSLTINTQQYHQYKAMSHLPVLMFLALRDRDSAESVGSEIQSLLEAARADSSIPAVPSALLSDAIRVLFDSAGSTPPSFDQVRLFNTSLQPAFRQLLAMAAREEAEQSLRAVQKLRQMIGDPSRWG